MNDVNFLPDFFIGRVKRLFPALLVCVFLTSLLGLLFLSPAFAEVSIKTGSKALYAMANIYLIAKSLNYFSISTA